MAKIIIDIPNQMYQAVKDGMWCGNHIIGHAIENGTVLPDNVTNGDMLRAIYPNAEVKEDDEFIAFGIDDETNFYKEWWNSPYNGGKE